MARAVNAKAAGAELTPARLASSSFIYGESLITGRISDRRSRSQQVWSARWTSYSNNWPIKAHCLLDNGQEGDACDQQSLRPIIGPLQ